MQHEGEDTLNHTVYADQWLEPNLGDTQPNQGKLVFILNVCFIPIRSLLNVYKCSVIHKICNIPLVSSCFHFDLIFGVDQRVLLCTVSAKDFLSMKPCGNVFILYEEVRFSTHHSLICLIKPEISGFFWSPRGNGNKL